MDFFRSLFAVVFLVSKVVCEYGVLVVESEDETGQFCASYAITHSWISTNVDEAKAFPLVDVSWWDGCEEPTTNIDKWKNSIVALNVANCSTAKKALNMFDLGAAGIIIADSRGVPKITENSPIENFTIAVIRSDSFARIQAMGEHVMVKQFVPPDEFYWDFAYVIIWFIAVTSVFVGGIWTDAARAKIDGIELPTDSSRMNDVSSADDVDNSSAKPNSTRTMCIALAIYFGWGTFLFVYVLLNYYFYHYMVYVDIALFAVAATIGLYWCFLPFIRRFPVGRHRLNYICCSSMEIRESIWFLICVAVTVTWCVCIRKSWIWALQNVLGMTLCISLLGSWRNSSLKTCTIILVVLFVYDIFMVFITPLFTRDGKSVMERMVIGGGEISDSLLRVPSVFQCPFLSTSPLAFCSQGYLILGYGDIIVPGILTSFCYDFGVKNKTSNIYFISSMIGYCVGLILTGIFMNLMHVIQPALLYLVPSCLLPVFVIAIVRREFKCLWYNHPLGYKLFNNHCAEASYEDSSFTCKSSTLYNFDA